MEIKVNYGLNQAGQPEWCRAVVPNLGPPDGLQLPEAFTTTFASQDFWELKSKNIWRPKVGGNWSTGHFLVLTTICTYQKTALTIVLCLDENWLTDEKWSQLLGFILACCHFVNDKVNHNKFIVINYVV